jgi:hypothetical protein
MLLISQAEDGRQISDVCRSLQASGFGRTKKSKDRLSSVLRGKEAIPGTGAVVALAKSGNKRLHAIPGWEQRLSSALGEGTLVARPTSPF